MTAIPQKIPPEAMKAISYERLLFIDEVFGK
jgi:hypothetical protein